jgi:hypothetical protein
MLLLGVVFGWTVLYIRSDNKPEVKSIYFCHLYPHLQIRLAGLRYSLFGLFILFPCCAFPNATAGMSGHRR